MRKAAVAGVLGFGLLATVDEFITSIRTEFG